MNWNAIAVMWYAQHLPAIDQPCRYCCRQGWALQFSQKHLGGHIAYLGCRYCPLGELIVCIDHLPPFPTDFPNRRPIDR